MNADEFNILTEKIYPDDLDRENAKYACKMIIATERLANAEKNFKDVQNELRTYLEKYNGNFRGSFLISRNDKILSDLRNLTNLTFGEKNNENKN